MKNILFALLFSSTTTFACADLSGSYVAETGETMEIQQQGCEVLRLVHPGHTQTFILDNEMREIFRDEHLVAYAAAHFVPSSPIIRMTWENHFTDTIQKHFRRLALFQGKVLLDQRGKYRSDGYFIPDHQITFNRVR